MNIFYQLTDLINHWFKIALLHPLSLIRTTLISALNFLFLFFLQFLMFNFLLFFLVYRYMTTWLRPLDFVFMHLLWGTFWCLIPGECLVFILFMRWVNIYRYKRKQKTKQQQLSLSSLKDSKSKFKYKNQISKSLAVSFEFYFKLK